MSNTITAYFKGRVGVAEAVYQNDYGIVMNFDSIDLPAHFDCYFSVPGSDSAIPAVGADNRVVIPNTVLGLSGNMSVHIPLHTGESDSEVEYVIYFKVIGRARPEDDGTPAQMTAIEQALALLQNPITNIEQIVNEALSFTGDTFAEMKQELQDDFDDYTETLEGDLATWKGGVEEDFSVLQGQFDTAVAAVTTDTEVTDIRVGADGVTDTTAGASVRRQFTDLKSDSLQYMNDSYAITLPDATIITDWTKDATKAIDLTGSVVAMNGYSIATFNIRSDYMYKVDALVGSNYDEIIFIQIVATSGKTINYEAPNNSRRIKYITGVDGVCKVSYRDTGSSAIEISKFPLPISDLPLLLSLTTETARINDDMWARGYIATTNGTHIVDDYACAYIGFVHVLRGSVISVNASGYSWNVEKYSAPSTAAFYETSYRISTATKYTITEDCYIRFSIWKSDDTSESVESLKQKFVVSGLFDAKNSNPEKSAQTYKDVTLIEPPYGWYEGQQNDYTFGTANSTSTQVYAKYDSLITINSERMSKNQLGVSSDNKPIYEYCYNPPAVTVDADAVKPLPIILIVCGLHGGEKSSMYGTYYFLKDVLENFDKSPLLEYIRDNVEIKVIPVANPYGVDTARRWNANHVNINRNFDVPEWSYVSDTESANYAGESPADQPETVIIQNWIKANKNRTVIVIDYHTYGGFVVEDWYNVNWHSYPISADAYFLKLYDASRSHINKITSMLVKEYELIDASGSLGRINAEDIAGTDTYAVSQGVRGMTFEGFNGFPSDEEAYSVSVKKANSELIGNWIISVMSKSL